MALIQRRRGGESVSASSSLVCTMRVKASATADRSLARRRERTSFSLSRFSRCWARKISVALGRRGASGGEMGVRGGDGCREAARP
ncbi:hypothetical protein B484DRAFT_236986 [Ochromonadaceae sp. CCMP2298]|nr:hypothetical protein B484DRAFT_236986 [Ochromonadaceae sp. CCMP2298]